MLLVHFLEYCDFCDESNLNTLHCRNEKELSILILKNQILDFIVLIHIANTDTGSYSGGFFVRFSPFCMFQYNR